MTKTIEQQIAAKQAELDRLKTKQRKLEAGQKIILGGLLLSKARNNAKIRKWLLDESVTLREADKKRLESLLDELKAMSSEEKEETDNNAHNKPDYL